MSRVGLKSEANRHPQAERLGFRSVERANDIMLIGFYEAILALFTVTIITGRGTWKTGGITNLTL